MELINESGTPDEIARTAVRFGEKILRQQNLDAKLYKATITKKDGNFIIRFVDKEYVYQRGHRGSMGKLPTANVTLREDNFEVVKYYFSR